jgi:hypothetical protein
MEARGTTEPETGGKKKRQQKYEVDASTAPSSHGAKSTNHDGKGDEQNEEDQEDDEEDEDEDEEDEEPRLKYASLTKNLSLLYRNGDASSSFLAGGDKMVRST